MSVLLSKDNVEDQKQSENGYNKVKLLLDQKEVELPIIRSNEGAHGFEITRLKEMTGCVTYDNGMANTAVCKSSITYVDGDVMVQREKGFSIM